LIEQYTRPTNNNYTQDNLKLAKIHARQIRIQHVQKVKTPKKESTVFSFFYYMYYYIPEMLVYQDMQSIHFQTRRVLLYTNLKYCTPSTVLCLIHNLILPDVGRQTLREARELKGDYQFCGEYNV